MMQNNDYGYSDSSSGKIQIEHFSIKKRVLTKKGSDFQYMVPWTMTEESLDSLDKKSKLMELAEEEKELIQQLKKVRAKISELKNE